MKIVQTNKKKPIHIIEMEAYHYKNGRFRGKRMKKGQKMEEMAVWGKGQRERGALFEVLSKKMVKCGGRRRICDV